jgi:hypothetical protein
MMKGLCVLGTGGIYRLPGTGPTSMLLGDVGHKGSTPSQHRQLTPDPLEQTRKRTWQALST